MAAHDHAEQAPAPESWDNPGPRFLQFLHERSRVIEAELRNGGGMTLKDALDEIFGPDDDE